MIAACRLCGRCALCVSKAVKNVDFGNPCCGVRGWCSAFYARKIDPKLDLIRSNSRHSRPETHGSSRALRLREGDIMKFLRTRMARIETNPTEGIRAAMGILCPAT